MFILKTYLYFQAMTLFLPCIRNELVCFGGIVSFPSIFIDDNVFFQSLLALYSMIYTDYPMGQDPTPLSHTYDLVTSFPRISHILGKRI